MEIAVVIWLKLYTPAAKPAEFLIVPAPAVTIDRGSVDTTDASVDYGYRRPLTPYQNHISHVSNMVSTTNDTDTNVGIPQQPGYIEVCPDGTPAQGSCETPGGDK